MLKIVVKKPEFFVSEESGEKLKQLGKDELHFIKLVPKQLPKGISEKDIMYESGTQSTIFLVVVAIVLMMKGQHLYFWTFLNAV